MLRTPRLRARRGFTLVEVLTAFFLIAVLAATTVPVIRARVQDGYEAAIIQEYQTLSQAISAYRRDIGHYPPTLTYLTQLPSNPTDLCLNALSASDTLKWNGPYVSRSITASYTLSQRDLVQTTLTRTGALLAIQITNIDAQTVADLDAKIDASDGSNAGTIRWTPNGNSNAVNYNMPVRTSAC